MSRSETAPNLAPGSNRGSFSRVKSYDTKEREREQRDRDRRNLGRRQTTAGNPGPTSVRMVESRSADSRTRLRSTGGAKLTRYPTLATEYPSARLRRTATHDNTSPSTPPPSAASARPHSHHLTLAEPEQLDFGGPNGLEAKLVLLGSQGVGKTSLILRLTTGSFNAERASASVEGSVYKRKLEHNGHPIKLQIWDTAGQERFRSMAPIYYRGAHVCILVYDISDRKSFQDVQSWLDELNHKASKDMMIYVVGAKLDLGSQRAVSLSEASRTIRRWLNPAPEPEPEEVLAAPRSLFRSTSTTRPRSDSMSLPSPQRRPHSMHGLASLMLAATDFEFDLSASTGGGSQAPTLVAPSPAPTVHFPPSLVTPTSIPGAGTSASSTASVAGSVGSPPSAMYRRQQRVSFHGPSLAEPTSATTAETAVASTANGSKHRLSTSRFSLSGMLGLARSPTSDAMANLSHLADANPVVSPRSPRPSLSPGLHGPHGPRVRTESSPLLDGKRRSEDWSATGPGWGRGEGPSAADALEEFGAAAASASSWQSQSAQSSPWAISPAPSSLPVPRQRLRGGSLGRDTRLFDDESSDDEPDDTWGIDIGSVRVGEVSSLTGEGVESLLRSISAQLIERKDKIEREHTLRRKNSVMLTDPAKDKRPAKKGFSCCA